MCSPHKEQDRKFLLESYVAISKNKDMLRSVVQSDVNKDKNYYDDVRCVNGWDRITKTSR